MHAEARTVVRDGSSERGSLGSRLGVSRHQE